MGIETKTTKEIAAQNVANIESRIGQETPSNDFAYNKVLAGVDALIATSLRKFAQERSLANLAETAQNQDLLNIGEEYGIIIKKAQAAVLDVSIPAADTTVVPATVILTGDNNGELYFPDNDSPPAAGGFVLLTISAENTGVIGNLNDGETLSLNIQVPGVEPGALATVLSTVTIGAEEEDQEAYRQRVKNAIRKLPGAGNTGTIREFAEAVVGVTAAFPFTGRPFGDVTPTKPPDRTIYVQADDTIDPDGIAPVALLDAVRDDLNTDPETGISRLVLGLTDDATFVESISREEFFVEIRDLVTPAGQEAQVKSDVEAALTVYFFATRMFVEGLDAEEERNDEITDLTVSGAVQDVLKVSNSSASGVGFGKIPGVFLGITKLDQGTLGKLGLPVVFAT